MKLGGGSVILAHNDGWACAREAMSSVEFDMLDVDGQKVAKKTLIIQINSIFDCVGECNNFVRGIFKHDDGQKFAFNGNMQGKSKLIIQGEPTEDFETILKEIKKWQSIKVNY